MKYSIVLILLITVGLYPSMAQYTSFVEVQDIEQLKLRLTSQAEFTKSIESKFVQEKHLWMLEEVIISKGIFLFKKENNVRWQYNTPVEYIISIHNGKFTILSNNKINEFDIDSNPMFREINSMIVTAISGDFIDNPDFLAKFKENESLFLAELVPINKNVSSMLSSIEIYFSKVNMEVVKVIFNEPGDDFTSILFQDKKVNIDIPDENFIIEKK